MEEDAERILTKELKPGVFFSVFLWFLLLQGEEIFWLDVPIYGYSNVRYRLFTDNVSNSVL